MRSKDSGLLLAVLVLVFALAGAVIYFSVLKPGERATQNETSSESDRPGKQDKPGKRNPGPSCDGRTPVARDGADKSTKIEPDKHDPPPLLPDAAGVQVRGVVVDAEDEPLGGIPLVLLREETDSTSGSQTSSGPEGRFEFEPTLMSGARFFVAYTGREYAVAATEVFELAGAGPVEGLKLVLHRPSKVRGLVLEADTRRGLEDALISFEPQRRDERLSRLGRLASRLRPARSQGDGSFSLEGLPPGQLVVTALKPGWVANELNPATRGRQVVELAPGADVELLPFMLVRAAEITGRVLRKDDKSPVVGARVEMGTPMGGNLGFTLTDQQGAYRLEAPPAIDTPARGPADDLFLGAVEIRALAPGLGSGSARVRPLAAKPTVVPDILLEVAATIRGRVQTHDGEPIANASVHFNDTEYWRGAEQIAGISLPPRNQQVTTGPDGRFELGSLPARSCVLGVTAEGWWCDEVTVETRAGQVSEVVIIMHAAGEISGTVTDEHGDPIEGVAIAAFRSESHPALQTVMRSFFGERLPDRGDHSLFPPAIITGADGRYAVKGLASKPHVLLANHLSYAKHASKPIEVRAGKTTTYDITLPLGGIIFGKVYDANQRGAPGAAVTCARFAGEGDIAVRTAFTDSTGHYELMGLSPGAYTVQRNEGRPDSFMLPNASNMVNVKAGERTRFDIHERKPGFARLYGRVTLDRAVYAEQDIVLLGAGRKGATMMTARTDQHGNYEFNNVALGRYQICERRSGTFFPTLVRVEVLVDKGGDLRRDIELFTASISGTIIFEDGSKPTGRVTIYAGPVGAQGDDGKASNVSALEELMSVPGTYDKETGTYEIKGLSPGFYRVTVIAYDAGSVRKPRVDARRDVVNLHLVVMRDNGVLGGVVKGLDDVKPATPMGWGGAVVIEDSSGSTLQLPMGGVVRLDPAKKFTVQYLPAGTYTITLQISGFAPCTVSGVVIESGKTTNVEFTVITSGHAKIIVEKSELNLDEAYDLTYEIRDSEGKLFKKRFTVFDFINSDGTVVQSEGENAFVVRDLPQGSYTISFTHPAYKPASAAFAVIAGQTTEVPVTFERR